MINKKAYFKGLGTGIIVTSALFFIFVYAAWPSSPSNVNTTITTSNTEVDETESPKEETSIVGEEIEVIDDTINAMDEQATTTNSDAVSANEGNDTLSEKENTQKETPQKDNTDEEKKVETSTDAEVINVVIPSGYTSNGVGIILYDHDIIDDYKAFNDYSVVAKKDYSIQSGTYQLRKGADFDEILGIIAP